MQVLLSSMANYLQDIIALNPVCLGDYVVTLANWLDHFLGIKTARLDVQTVYLNVIRILQSRMTSFINRVNRGLKH